MQLWEIFLIGLGLSADAFAVAICKGVEMKRFQWKYALVIALCFGGFQMLMPLIGWSVASQLEQMITSWDHWIAFALLAILGVKMIFDSFRGEEPDPDAPLRLGWKTLLAMSVATSIDALAVGVTFAFLSVNIWISVALIGATTFVCSVFGVLIGAKAGCRFQHHAERIGGAILILIGIKILLEHLGFLTL